MWTLILFVCHVNTCAITEVTGTYSKLETCKAAVDTFQGQKDWLDRLTMGAYCIPAPENGYFE